MYNFTFTTCHDAESNRLEKLLNQLKTFSLNPLLIICPSRSYNLSGVETKTIGFELSLEARVSIRGQGPGQICSLPASCNAPYPVPKPCTISYRRSPDACRIIRMRARPMATVFSLAKASECLCAVRLLNCSLPDRRHSYYACLQNPHALQYTAEMHTVCLFADVTIRC